MNKNEVVNKINIKTGLSKKECKLCLESMLEIISLALKNGESVTLSNFGKFKVNDVKSKNLYNFKTKSMQVVESKKTPTFKASESLKQCIK